MTEDEVEWWDYETPKEMAEAVSGDIGFLIGQAIEAHGRALVAVPGGKTPQPIFKALARQKLDWAKVTFIPTDDRLVAAGDPLSNVAMIRELLGPTGATIVPLAEGVSLDDRHAAARAADARLAELDWPLDLAWLGIGADGHTASIFPGPDYESALDAPRGRHVVGVLPDPLPREAPVARLTLTRATLSTARSLLITFSGEEKKAVLERAIADGPMSRLPIGRVLAEFETPVDIHWSA
ncbi:6-phosphogluconolactonase [Sphingomonas quercus]|uniref:6-phosphogluconolactonase n=1 Tax=Sphingomonas quercus TaxID=2842451 RepID=A0ABS6BJT2_9SPHN|nr:6-phosphogluconolactonase [Sphingomonas quercus]MBU3078545.1 6-phosphogluconolactonase [Sphingomonas quercus]